MADEAVRFMPASLRLALEKHRESLLRGLLEPMVHEDGPAHQPPWSGGTLDRQLEQPRPERWSTALGDAGRPSPRSPSASAAWPTT